MLSTDLDELAQRFAGDAELLLQALREHHERCQSRLPDLEVELYHRAALTLRVGFRERAAVESAVGHDQGLALRARGGDGRTRFAACSGSDPRLLESALAPASSDQPSLSDDPASWCDGGAGLARDHETALALPPRAELEAWLTRGLESTTGVSGHRLHEGWAEVALTIESLVGSRGAGISRTRQRAWSLFKLKGPAQGRTLVRPIMLAARDWAELHERRWDEVFADRWPVNAAPGSTPNEPRPLVLGPEASAALVQALVRRHDFDPATDQPVGPGWQLVDDPRAPGALFGGTFDDTGQPTRRRVLADGARWLDSVGGAGTYRRASFRDMPVAAPSQIVVTAPGGAPPDRGLLATQIALHPLAPAHWVIELEGAILEAGLPVVPLRAYVSIAPDDLVQRCVGAVGPSRDSHLGIRTPALVFDGLRAYSHPPD